MKKALIFTLLILVSLGISAQRNRRAKTPPPPTPEELAEMARKEKYERKLQAIERVTFIDSVLVKKDEVFGVISLGSENGSVLSSSEYFKEEKVNSLDLTLFRSQLGDKIIFAKQDANNILQLYASEKLGTKWSKHQLLTGLQDTIAKNYPYMLSDGMTMYYAAQDEEGLGGYDIYKTRWDIDEQKYVGGICLRDEIICGCCGSICKIDAIIAAGVADGKHWDDVIIELEWVNISDFIL